MVFPRYGGTHARGKLADRLESFRATGRARVITRTSTENSLYVEVDLLRGRLELICFLNQRDGASRGSFHHRNASDDDSARFDCPSRDCIPRELSCFRRFRLGTDEIIYRSQRLALGPTDISRWRALDDTDSSCFRGLLSSLGTLSRVGFRKIRKQFLPHRVFA